MNKPKYLTNQITQAQYYNASQICVLIKLTQVNLNQYLLVNFKESSNKLKIIPQERYSVQKAILHTEDNLIPNKSGNNSSKQFYSETKIEDKQNTSLFSSDKPSMKKICCNCKKSQCIKLYCECFVRQEFCSGCNCVNCLNIEENKTEIDKIVRTTLDRNPKAFEAKIASDAIIVAK